MNYTVKDRFLRYVQIDTEADPMSTSYPSSEKQKNLTKVLMDELTAMGLSPVTNDAGYVYAHLDSNISHDCKTVFFCAHIDTAPDCSGCAIGYSLETFLGPLEAKYTWSPENSESFWMFNLGFWF